MCYSVIIVSFMLLIQHNACLYMCYDNHLLETVNRLKLVYKMNSESNFQISHGSVCCLFVIQVIWGQLETVTYKILLKISVKCPTFLPHVMLSVTRFNKKKNNPLLGTDIMDTDMESTNSFQTAQIQTYEDRNDGKHREGKLEISNLAPSCLNDTKGNALISQFNTNTVLVTEFIIDVSKLTA